MSLSSVFSFSLILFSGFVNMTQKFLCNFNPASPWFQNHLSHRLRTAVTLMGGSRSIEPIKPK